EKERSIPAGSGQKLTFKVARSDGFEGPVRVNISGLPAGFVASAPVVIEGGHETATIVLNAAADAASPSEEALNAIVVTASASIDGRLVVQPVDGLKKLTVGETPKAVVTL